MVFANAHTLITFGGTAWAEVEEWQFGLRVLGSLPPSEGQLDDLEAAAVALMGSPMNISNKAQLEYVKCAPIQADGTYPPELPATLRVLDTPVAGASPNPTYPQITLVVSLRTGWTRGPAHAGRFYPPPTTHGTAADGRLSESSAQSYADAAADFINAVNAVDLGRVSVFSQLPSGTGTTREVTEVAAGRVFDTQRRRRNHLQEGYMLAAVDA